MHIALLASVLTFNAAAASATLSTTAPTSTGDEAKPTLDAPPESASLRTAQGGRHRLRLELPLLDTRNLGTLESPSLRQSMAYTKDAYYLGHLPALELSRYLGGGEWLAIPLTDLAIAALPLGYAWLHEEWHRGVLGRRGIGSYNGVYDFEFGAEVTKVSDVSDEALSRLKREHPAEMVRLSSAGIESQHALSLEFDKDRFFYGTRAGTVFQQWQNTLSAIAYMATASSASGDEVTARLLRDEGTNVAQRDFTGMDPVGWVYDLHRPDEPYEARGVHPSGVGVDRYRTTADLTASERGYLRTQTWLTALNFVNPNLFGLHAFEFDTASGAKVRWNASVQHYLTPFGSSTTLNGFLQVDSWQWFLQLHAHANANQVLPGASVGLMAFPGVPGRLVAAAHLWLQPEDQSFFARKARPGAAVELRSSLPIGRSFEVYSALTAKTAGWLAGNEYLDAEWDAVLGLQTIAF